MPDRESRLPLLIGAVFAVILHAALAPVWGLGLSGVTPAKDTRPPDEDQPLPEPEATEVGRAHADVTNLAWIAYDDFQELLAQHAIVEQPALQKQVDPVPDAPIELDPTPPTPVPQEDQPHSAASQTQPQLQTRPVNVSPVGPVPLPQPEPAGELPYAPDGPMPSDTDVVAPGSSGESERKPAPKGQTGAPSRPTSAPRDTGESPPVTIIIHETFRVRPGAVLTADGIEVKTVIPRPRIPTIYGTVPKNPTLDIWFDPDGKATRVDVTRTSGVDGWDDAVVTAMEQWTATGERIENLKGKIKLTVQVILSHE